jgi:hypothetical protein
MRHDTPRRTFGHVQLEMANIGTRSFYGANFAGGTGGASVQHLVFGYCATVFFARCKDSIESMDKRATHRFARPTLRLRASKA